MSVRPSPKTKISSTASLHGGRMMRVRFNSGTWTDEEHQDFLRGLEVYGRGNWEAIGIFVPARSPLQIEAHAQQHFVGDELVVRSEEVQVDAQRPPSGQAPFPRPCSSSSSSSCLSCNDGGSGGGSLWELPVVAHLVYGVLPFHLEEELCYPHIGICDATAIGTLDGLLAVYAQQQQQQASMHGEGCQSGEQPFENLVVHGVPYPHRIIWEEPALGKALRSRFALDDFGGVL